MKIKKIDIQAFRLFHEETVHLTAKRDISKPANFVAVYAPNGFGKTSFFDAMEFCMTGKIHRLADNLSENEVKTKSNRVISPSYTIRTIQRCMSPSRWSLMTGAP